MEQAVFDESTLSPEERKMVEDFASQIELSNSNLILQYGAGAQKKMADFSETTLSHVKTRDLGEIGEALSRVVSELRSFDEEEEKGFLQFFSVICMLSFDVYVKKLLIEKMVDCFSTAAEEERREGRRQKNDKQE